MMHILCMKNPGFPWRMNSEILISPLGDIEGRRSGREKEKQEP
jgi:hypothetical protein